MEAFKLLVTIERTIELRFKVDTIRFIILYLFIAFVAFVWFHLISIRLQLMYFNSFESIPYGS